MTRAVLLALLLVPRMAAAEPPPLPSFDHAPPCDQPILDPVVTAVRDAKLDLQRSACMRQQVTAGINAHALVDTPGYHGVLGGDLTLAASTIIGKAHELSAELRVIDYAFVQDAVNKVTHTGFGPLVLGAAAGKPISPHANAALSLRVEMPATRGDSDTLRSSAQLAGLVTGLLSPHVALHGRLATLGSVASSEGGTTKQLAFAAGLDLAWLARPTVALHLGADMMGGWQAGFDHLLARTGVHWRPRRYTWRMRLGVGLPVAGDERTNAIVDLAFVVDR